MNRWWVECGSSELLLPELDFSVDALVTDPPAAIGFMGRSWDSDRGGRGPWVAWLANILRQCNRIMKPGAHAFVWALPRTSHWTMAATEDAGFEIRDVIVHLFGQGFPKSLNVSKAIDKDTGEAAEWDGWGSALKPAAEHWILARKPLDGTLVQNVLTHGTGAINVDGCRVPTQDNLNGGAYSGPGRAGTMMMPSVRRGGFGEYKQPPGRWPPDVAITHDPRCDDVACHHECPARMLDDQSGDRPGMSGGGSHRSSYAGGMFGAIDSSTTARGDDGGASRFFPRFRYAPKASTADRNFGLDRNNNHPTVKSIELMRWLVRLVTPTGGLVLDPFAGSGSTGVAALLEGSRFVGITDDENHADMARDRCAAAAGNCKDPTKKLGCHPVKTHESQQSIVFSNI